MTVSTVMQLQKHQPGSRRFTILAGDSQGQQYIAVMTGQMLAGEISLEKYLDLVIRRATE